MPQQSYLSTAVSLVDRVADFHTRQNVYNTVRNFCLDRPVLASFAAVQLLFFALPIFFFLGFAGFCIMTAACFAAFWIGVAAMFLTSTLLLLSFFAASLWVYLAACFYVVRYLAIRTGYLDSSSTALVPSKTSTSLAPSPAANTSTATNNNTTKPTAAAPPTPKKSSTEVKLKSPTPNDVSSTDKNNADSFGFYKDGPDVSYGDEKMGIFGEKKEMPMIPGFA